MLKYIVKLEFHHESILYSSFFNVLTLRKDLRDTPASWEGATQPMKSYTVHIVKQTGNYKPLTSNP